MFLSKFELVVISLFPIVDTDLDFDNAISDVEFPFNGNSLAIQI